MYTQRFRASKVLQYTLEHLERRDKKTFHSIRPHSSPARNVHKRQEEGERRGPNLLVSNGEEVEFAVRELSQYSQTINGHGTFNDSVNVSVYKRL